LDAYISRDRRTSVLLVIDAGANTYPRETANACSVSMDGLHRRADRQIQAWAGVASHSDDEGGAVFIFAEAGGKRVELKPTDAPADLFATYGQYTVVQIVRGETEATLKITIRRKR